MSLIDLDLGRLREGLDDADPEKVEEAAHKIDQLIALYRESIATATQLIAAHRKHIEKLTLVRREIKYSHDI